MAELNTYTDPDAGGAGTGVNYANAYNSLLLWEAGEEADLDGDGDYLINHCKSGGYNKSETGGFVCLI